MEEEHKKRSYKKNVFHPHDTTTSGLLDFRRAAALVSYGWKVEKDKKEKAEGWWYEGSASPTRVLFRIRAEHRASPRLHSLSISTDFSFFSLSLSLSLSLLFSSLLCSMNPRGISSRNITHRTPRLSFLLYSPSTIPLHRDVRSLCPPIQAILRPPLAALASRPRNIKPTPPYFPSDSIESP